MGGGLCSAGALLQPQTLIGQKTVLEFLNNLWGARNRVGVGLSYRPARARIFKLLRSPRIDSTEPIPPGCVPWRAAYDNLIPTRFLAPIDCLKIPA
jgi:hypothetical protein